MVSGLFLGLGYSLLVAAFVKDVGAMSSRSSYLMGGSDIDLRGDLGFRV